jgi:hypothetical protein
LFIFRVSEQDFAEIHNNLRRGDIIGVKGKPGTVYYITLLLPIKITLIISLDMKLGAKDFLLGFVSDSSPVSSVPSVT